jgi:hypothetical protein
VVLNKKKGAAPIGTVPPKQDNKEAGEVEDWRQTHQWEEALEDCWRPPPQAPLFSLFFIFILLFCKLSCPKTSWYLYVAMLIASVMTLGTPLSHSTYVHLLCMLVLECLLLHLFYG